MCQVLVQPPIDKWQLAQATLPAARCALQKLVNAHAKHLGTAPLENSAKIIATGHQPWLWHPGILAKDIAAQQTAWQLSASPLHLIVDQDVHPAASLKLPVVTKRAPKNLKDHYARILDIAHIHLGQQNVGVPIGFQPAMDEKKIVESLKNAKHLDLAIDSAGLDRLIAAFTNLPQCKTLAQQFAVALHRLKKPWAGNMPVIFTSDLAQMQSFKQFVQAMREDARNSVLLYNSAVSQYPKAGMTQLIVERERVELPLWACKWMCRRQKVYADLADSKPILTLEDGTEIDHSTTILPRALAMTAFMRSGCVDFFIHGKGGGVYDKITEQWWQKWQPHSALAPQAVVSADLYLDFSAPVADAKQLARAKWYKHWLAHNVDRALGKNEGKYQASDGTHSVPYTEKTALLKQMNDDRNKKRRRVAFKRIHQINHALLKSNPDLLAEADQQLRQAETGVQNADLAAQRDWCFALYEEKKLDQMVNKLQEVQP